MNQKRRGKYTRRELWGLQHSKTRAEREVRTGFHKTPHSLHSSFESILFAVKPLTAADALYRHGPHLNTSSICKSSSFSDIASPLSSCSGRDLRSGPGNTTVGLREYSDIGGLWIRQLSTPGTYITAYITIEFAALVRLDTVATCGSPRDIQSLRKYRRKNGGHTYDV